MSSPDGSPSSELTTMLRSAPVVLCLGPGGVGKTTVAASLALAAAQEGRSAVVLTIDPARRLADAMGLPRSADGDHTKRAIGNEPHRIAGPWTGELWASMLDPSDTFDTLIRGQTESEEQARRILDNRLYRNLSRSLSGTNEYMAAERLRSLHLDDRFDLVVVDTPPAKHAFDFLDGPARLMRFFDHRLYRSVLAPRSGVLRAVSAPSRLMMKTLSRFVGAAFVEDVIDFFDAFSGIDQGFRDRAAEVEELLMSEAARYVVVASPRTEPLAEAQWIGGRLRDRARSVSMLVINRRTPDFGAGRTRAKATAADRNLADLASLRAAEEAAVADAAEQIGADTMLDVAEQERPVADVSGLVEVASALRSVP